MLGPGCVTKRSLATLEDQSSIPGAGNNNVLVTRSEDTSVRMVMRRQSAPAIQLLNKDFYIQHEPLFYDSYRRV